MMKEFVEEKKKEAEVGIILEYHCRDWKKRRKRNP